MFSLCLYVDVHITDKSDYVVYAIMSLYRSWHYVASVSQA